MTVPTPPLPIPNPRRPATKADILDPNVRLFHVHGFDGSHRLYEVNIFPNDDLYCTDCKCIWPRLDAGFGWEDWSDGTMAACFTVEPIAPPEPIYRLVEIQHGKTRYTAMVEVES